MVDGHKEDQLIASYIYEEEEVEELRKK